MYIINHDPSSCEGPIRLWRASLRFFSQLVGDFARMEQCELIYQVSYERMIALQFADLIR